MTDQAIVRSANAFSEVNSIHSRFSVAYTQKLYNDKKMRITPKTILKEMYQGIVLAESEALSETGVFRVSILVSRM